VLGTEKTNYSLRTLYCRTSFVLFRRARNIAKGYCWLRHVCPYVTTRLPLGGYSWNLILMIFRKSMG